MPKKTAAKKTTNSKRKASRPSSARSTTRAVSSRSLPLHERHFLAHEQHAFHQDHPNAQMLLTVFIGAAIVLMILYLSKYGLNRIAY